jgi:lipoprotein-anchoring transpeptidase ErfK/SrfK
MARPSLLTLLGVLIVAVLGLAAVGISQRQRTTTAKAASRPLPTPTVADEAVPSPVPPRRDVQRSSGWSVLRVKPGATLKLRAKRNGRVVTSVGADTRFGSPTTLTVAARKGDWVGVTSTDLPNGELGWTKARPGQVETHTTKLAIRIDLSARRLELVKGRRVVRRATVGIGRPGSPTPTGRFSITDKLSGAAYGPYYGCCILALSGHQTNTPAGWRGGDRLAIHGTNAPSSIGRPSSAGCLHADAEDLKVLMRRVPLGTPVFIRG